MKRAGGGFILAFKREEQREGMTHHVGGASCSTRMREPRALALQESASKGPVHAPDSPQAPCIAPSLTIQYIALFSGSLTL